MPGEHRRGYAAHAGRHGRYGPDYGFDGVKVHVPDQLFPGRGVIDAYVHNNLPR